MQTDTGTHKRKDLRNLLLVLFASVCAAFFLTVYFIYNYGSTGQYRLTHVLMEPSLLSQLNYNDKDPKTGGTSRYSFNSIEFNWYDDQTKRWKKLQVDTEKYALLFSFLSGDLSIKEVTDPIRNLFNQTRTANLIFTVKTESSAQWQENSKVFQETEFVHQGDYYRVELREQTSGEHWAYFYHPDVFKKVLEIMVPSQ